MMIVITGLHVIMCLLLIAIVLLQTGKGASMGAAFGGATNTLFGGAGPASFLNKITTVAAVIFMITSFTLAVISSRGSTSSKVLEAVPTQQEQPVQSETPASDTSDAAGQAPDAPAEPGASDADTSPDQE
jgi:preprotein translocase subunit SecG